MTTFITIIYIIVALVMVLSILLQAGKGGGLGSALGGGASQSVFGGGGGADFMSKLTQGFAATFMISAMYLAYASAHAGSEFLEEQGQSTSPLGPGEEIDDEHLGPRPQPLPTEEQGKQLQAKAAALVPAQSTPTDAELETDEDLREVPNPDPNPEVGADEEAAINGDGGDGGDRGDSPDSDRGDSPQGGEESLQKAPLDDKKSGDEREENSTKSPAEEPVG